ncbi:MAG TPA: bifunctional 4-hydroxy-2-oxoglutarate aldolase/2-dehydro-3-deoxy-phosphogluconate aldolase [Candidatus Methylomirabilis sp.]|nr:bifunctional 4-hydroxy-2-oxoglutarate aldolase/2-dehydro-3-deoxy-phosphogluconate aldolase [Candidatus Methylomirabilis sp.]
MSVMDAVERIVAGGVIAIIRLPGPGDLLPAAEALREGGITAIEFALTEPGAIQAIEAVRIRLRGSVLLGVGTVLSPEAARDAIRAGAEFLVGPTLNPEVIRAGREAGVPVIPGAFTPTEIVQAWDSGASLVQVFPAGPIGPRYIKDLRGSLPHIALVPTGGVSLENVGAFIYAGAAAVGVGGELVSQDLLDRRAFREITDRAQEFVEAIRRARRAAPHAVPPIKPIEGPDIR